MIFTMPSKKRRLISTLAIGMLIVLPGILFAAEMEKKITGKPMAPTMDDTRSIQRLNLETAKQIAFLKNPSIEAAKARVSQAQERIKQARAAYLPTITANASASKIDLSDSASASNQPDSQPKDPNNVYSAELGANWILFDGFERNYNAAAARFGKEADLFAQKETHRLLSFNVAESFYHAVSMRENIAVATANQDFYQRLNNDAVKRQKIGTGSLSDQLSLEVQLNAAQNELIRAKHEYQSAMAGLAAILGIASAGFPEQLKLADLKPELPREMVSLDVQALISEALLHRPDLNQSKSVLNQGRQSVKSVKASFYPKLDLSAALNGEREDDMGFKEDDFGSTLMLTLSYDLFTGGNKSARLREHQSIVGQARKEADQIKLTIKKEVRQACIELQMNQEQLLLQRKNAILVQRNRDLIEKEYLVGQNSLVTLKEAQRDLITAQSRLSQTLISLHLAWENLNACVGNNLSKNFF